jgi:uncharacterized membrane protein
MTSVNQRVGRALLLATALCAVFYGLRLWQLGGLAFSYLPWNLFLAWVPLGLSFLLIRYIQHHPWSNWPALLLSLIWLLFLPNSFYLVSDYIHLQGVPSETALYDAVMFTMFVLTGLLLGYVSLYTVHRELLKRLPVRQAAIAIGAVLLCCSFAMYIGRDLRWNSWDVLTSPAGLLFDLSNRFLHVGQYRTMFGTVALFFGLLAGIYYIGLQIIRAVRVSEADHTT